MTLAEPTLSPEMSFHTQGPIPPDLAHLYIARPCDQEVETLLARREYVSVIGPRLSGKSSLLMRQWARMREMDYLVPVYISLGSLRSLTPADWYGFVHQAITRQSKGLLPTPRAPAPHVLALQEELVSALENELRGHTVILMLDQVESVPPEIGTDFFASVREMYVNRWMRPALHNLVVLLAGRFMPDELITDPEISPFRITATVHMTDASLEGIKPLVDRLAHDTRAVADHLHERIFDWTEGDVYLTHKLCAALAREVSEGTILNADVDRVARKYLCEDPIFRGMWRQIQSDTGVYELIDTLLNHRERVRFTLLHRAVMVAWLEGAIKEDTSGHCVLHSLVHENVLHSLRATVADQTPQRPRSNAASLSGDKALLRDRFRVEYIIYPGLLTHVCRGTDVHTGLPVAIKQLTITRDLNEMAWHRFQRESEALRHLDHPNIVKLIDAFSEGDFEYIVMEYIHGGSLYDRLNREGRLPLRHALEMTMAVADALQHAHQRGVVHRDVKPSNIMLTPDLTPKLADFGVARLNYHSRVTLPQTVIGTTPYLSPEGCHGQPLDERTDIWSLGVTLFEMLTGTRPFVGTTDDLVARAILENDIPDIRTIRPHVPQPVIELVGRMLTKPSQHRIGSCTEVRETIQRILPGV